MRSSIVRNIYIFVGKEEVDYSYTVFWHCLYNDYEFNDTYNSLRTTLLNRV